MAFRKPKGGGGRHIAPHNRCTECNFRKSLRESHDSSACAICVPHSRRTTDPRRGEDHSLTGFGGREGGMEKEAQQTPEKSGRWPADLQIYRHDMKLKRTSPEGMVSAMDEGIGNLTLALKDSGMWNNTIFIFSTDNGGQILAGGNNWPLRGYKTTLWEGGMRGVGFVTGPLLKQQGKISDQLMHVSDWFPTIADMVGAKVNSSLKLDGTSQWQMISKGGKSKRTEILHNIDIWTPLKGKMLFNNTFDTRVRAAIRVGDWKLITGNPGDDRWIPPPHLEGHNSSLKATSPQDIDKNLWLFNIKKDPFETMDLSNVNVEKVEELLKRLAVYNTTAVPPQYPQSDPNCDPQLHGGFWGPWE